MTKPEDNVNITTKKYTLGLVWGIHQYEVKSITNSVEFVPGEWLNKDIVAEVCARKDWEVTITDNAALTGFLSFISGHLNPVNMP